MSEPVYILLPVHNRRSVTTRLVGALNDQTKPDFRLVLIDDGSRDGTAEAVRSLRPETIVIQGEGNWWWAGCLDQACQWLAKQNVPPDTVVCIMNDDVEIAADFVEQAVAELAENPGTLLLARQRDAATRQEFNGGGGVRVDLDRLIFKGESNPAAINCLPTRGLFLRWGDLQRAGGFRPRLFPHYLSDYEFTFRAHRRGLRLRVGETAAIYSLPNQSGWGAEGLFTQPRGRRVKILCSKRFTGNPVALSIFAWLAVPAWRWPKLALIVWGNFLLLFVRCVLYRSPAKPGKADPPGPSI